MENGVEAIRMGFSMFIFALALTTAMYIFSICGNTAKALVYYSDESNYYDNISLSATTKADIVKTREVGFDTVIPTLYRYYKENFCVKIYDKTGKYAEVGTSDYAGPNGKLIQIFDITTENKVNSAYKRTNGNLSYAGNSAMGIPKITDEEYFLLTTYGDKNKVTNLFGSPWNVNALEYAKDRVDFFINGSVGYINDVKVDYTNNGQPSDGGTANLAYYMNTGGIKIKEKFVQYNYSGDTISVGEGENIETLTGNKIPEAKIEITYTFYE